LLEKSSGHLELREDPVHGIVVAGLRSIKVLSPPSYSFGPPSYVHANYLIYRYQYKTSNLFVHVKHLTPLDSMKYLMYFGQTWDYLIYLAYCT